MQQRVHAEVELARAWSGWPARRTPAALGVPRSSSYRWLKEEAWAKDRPQPPPRPVAPYEALSEEKQAVIAHARKHPELRHRELARRMVDEDVAYLSPATVYRVLKEADPVCPRRRRAKRKRAAEAKATRPDQRWATDLLHLQVAERTSYFIASLDEYSRAIVHHELLLGMDGLTTGLAAQRAIETWPRGQDGRPVVTPEIRTDNGSGFISQEFHVALKETGLGHQRIRPHCPEENGLIERFHRTMREDLEGEELASYVAAGRVMDRLVRRSKHERLPSASGSLPPWEFYRGDPPRRFEERRTKLSQARHHRRQRNLQLRQGTLPLEGGEAVSSS